MKLKKVSKITCIVVLEDDEKFAIKCHAYPKAKAQYEIVGIEGKRGTGYAPDDILLIESEKHKVTEIYQMGNRFYLTVEPFPKKQ